jgi:hypothetical protein
MIGLVPLPVTADGAVRDEDSEEVIIKLLRRYGAESAEACQAVSFLVDHAITPPGVLRPEDQLKVINNFLILEFPEPAGTLQNQHAAASS